MDRVDVIIVGAGIAGLTAARELERSGRSVRVIEARDRVGGRTAGHTLQTGFVVEMGAQWVGPYQTEVLELIKQLGLETSTTYDSGQNITVHQGQTVLWRADEGTFGFPEATLYEIGRLQAELESMTEHIQLSRPWESPDAQLLDQQSVQQWIEANTGDERTRQFFDSTITGLFYGETEKMSLLHLLFFMKSNGSFDNMFTTSGGLQDSRIIGGSQRISERLAEELAEGTVRFGMPVRAIQQDEGGVNVAYGEEEARASYAIVAIPPVLANQIDYSPKLTEARARLTAYSTEVSIIKAQVVYSTPFWRESGLSGFIDHLDQHFITIDSSPADGSIGILAFFTVSTKEHPFASLTADQRYARIVESLTDTLGSQASEPIEYVDKVWIEEQFSRGCYGGRFGLGTWTQSGPSLTEPFGRIYWAGTETSDISNGYMDGAVRSGKRAAREVLVRTREESPERPGAVVSRNE